MFKLTNVKYKSILHIENMIIKGNITTIVGESGGGKTTLLRLLSKLISPDQGEISYQDTPLKDLNTISYRQNVVLLSQKPYIFEGTIEDNLLKGLSFHKKNATKEALKDVLERVKLNKDLSVNAKTLSGGESQRLALARILLLKPEVILLDEPSSALDEDTEKFVIEAVVNDVKNRQSKLIMVTHSKAIAKVYADDMFVMNQGTLKGEELNV